MPVSTPNGYLDFTNATPRATKVIATSNVGVGFNNPLHALDVAGTANVGALTATTLSATNTPLATIAANLVTYDSSTGVFQDSGGLFSNKLAVVSEQPPSALTGASTTVSNHGVYKVTASTGTPENAFDKSAGTSWSGSSDYTGGSGTGVYVPGTARLNASTQQGDWITLEFPYKTTVRHLTIAGGNVEKANLYATNDDITWTEIKHWESAETTVVVNASENYRKYGLVTTKTTGSSTISIGELRFFTESFSVDGGKVALATSAITGGNTVVDQTGPHARRATPVLRKYPEVLFTEGEFDGNDTTNTYTQGGYTVTTNGDQGSRHVWYSYDGSDSSRWHATGATLSSTGASNSNNPIIDTNSTTHEGVWTTLELPHKIKVKYIVVRSTGNANDDARRFKSGKLFGSDDNSNFNLIGTFESAANTIGVNRFDINSNTPYKYITFLCDKVWSGSALYLHDLQYYGHEETSDPDTSVDTTITSQFNLPDTTGVKLYLDGDKGSTATDYSGEGHTLTDNSESFTGNAWSFTSLATSNVTMSVGDLAMEGDHPHSVSMWFNCANVTSNATLFHVGTAAGEGDAKTAISLTETGHLGWIDGGDNQFLSANTWHNLVYATQGAGGVRTCYLDGRKLGDVAVQDTFGEYPPFAMTGYSQGGYTVSAGSESSGYEAYNAFDDAVSLQTDAWLGTFLFSGGNPSNTSNGKFGSNGGENDTNGAPGDWIKIALPNRLVLDSIDIYPRYATQYEAERFPKSGNVWASNDNTTWVSLSSWTNRTTGTNRLTSWLDSGDYSSIVTNATKGYKYFALHWTQTNGWNEAGIGNMKFIGHKENDTTRFPVSSTVLKYPHVAMTGPAQRGYVVTSSTDMYNSSGFYDWKVFNNVVNTNEGWHTGQLSGSTVVGDYVSDGTNYVYDTANYNDNLGGFNGAWLKLQVPRKIVFSHFDIYPRNTSVSPSVTQPVDMSIVGSNDDVNWTTLQTFTNMTQSTNGNYATYNVNATTGYKYFGFVVTKTNGTTVQIGELKLYGTEEDLDVVSRVGEGLDGRVANFRVYDKYLREEQALELWDAQKDQFGRAQSSVSVYRGHVGIGTTTPSAALTVMDEAEEMEEFPPRAMTDYENYMEGHGVFRVGTSQRLTGTNGAENVFDKKSLGTTASFWLVGDGAGYNASDGSYEGENGVIYRLAPETPTGHYVTLEMPYRIKLEKYSFMPRYNAEYQTPEDWELWGSNDGSSWTKLHNVIGNTEYLTSVTYDAPQTIYYRYFGFIVTRTIMTGAPSGNDYMSISELRYYGTRERGASTLHDGQLTLTKNLTVPRIGPAFDADDTPRRDRLVVEYNTSTNPTYEGAVRDTSGRGNDIIMHGNAKYDAIEKAFVFDGTTGTYMSGTQTLGTGTPAHTITGWFKQSISLDNYTTIFLIGTSGEGQQSGLLISDTGQIVFDIYTTRIDTEVDASTSIWYHFAGVFKGGTSTWDTSSCDLYINGVRESSSVTEGSVAFNLSGKQIHFGVNTNFSRYFNGSIANFKLYDVALTADEVKRLYDMGRCDEGHHVVNFSKTQVGIGLGDGEAPRAVLDVRGSIMCDGYILQKNVVCSRWIDDGDKTVSNTAKIPFDGNLYDPNNLWSTSSDAFVAPVAGVYLVHVNLMTDSTTSYDGNHELYLNNSPSTPRLRGFAVVTGANAHRNANSHFMVSLQVGDEVSVRAINSAVIYGSDTYAHSHVSIHLISDI